MEREGVLRRWIVVVQGVSQGVGLGILPSRRMLRDRKKHAAASLSALVVEGGGGMGVDGHRGAHILCEEYRCNRNDTRVSLSPD